LYTVRYTIVCYHLQKVLSQPQLWLWHGCHPVAVFTPAQSASGRIRGRVVVQASTYSVHTNYGVLSGKQQQRNRSTGAAPYFSVSCQDLLIRSKSMVAARQPRLPHTCGVL
jgi:hypothetical protein